MKSCNNCVHLGKQKKVHYYLCTNSKSEYFNIPFPHGKTRKACNLYKSEKQADLALPSDMRFIEDYRNKYMGSEFWIIGCDSNLDFYPNDFFRDKFSIAVGAACIAFPDSTFLFLKDPLVVEAIKLSRPDLLKRSIFVLYQKGMPWSNYGLDPIYIRPHMRKSSAQCTKEDWERTVQQIFGDNTVEFLSYGMGTSYAIQTAAVLGAKKIILVGCSGKSTRHCRYAHKRGVWAFCFEGFRDYSNGSMVQVGPGSEVHEYPLEIQAGRRLWLTRARQDLKWLTEILKEYRVEVIRHRFDEDKNKFIFEKIEN